MLYPRLVDVTGVSEASKTLARRPPALPGSHSITRRAARAFSVTRAPTGAVRGHRHQSHRAGGTAPEVRARGTGPRLPAPLGTRDLRALGPPRLQLLSGPAPPSPAREQRFSPTPGPFFPC